MTSDPHSSPQLQAQAEEAERLARQGLGDAAARAWEGVLALAPQHARALSFFAMRAFARGDLGEARRLIDQAVAGSPRSALVEANRALVLRAQGEFELAIAALQEALALDREFLPARFDLAMLLEERGRLNDAVDHYRIALGQLPPPAMQPPPLRERVARAEAALARQQAALEATVQRHLEQASATLGDADRSRFDECLDIFLGRKRPQLPKPGMMYFPKLAPLSFYPREMFPWVAAIEAASGRILAELQAMLADDDSGFIPYVQKAAEDAGPGSAWNPLNHNRNWGAYFLYNQGQRVDRHCARCPDTAAALEALPQVRIPGRAPTAFFSRLQPGTHIPPHHGATNTRLVAHLPLIVPPDCGIRVGNDVRAWVPGQMLIFDDTLEHEAWNRSDAERVVLIFDVWNPFLSAAEQTLVTAMTAGLAEFYPDQQHNTDF